MSRVDLGSVTSWLSFTCPFCKAHLRIKEVYAHMRGRCPECGGRIEALKPPPLLPAPTLSESDEPLGLLPIEEEWPEPAQLDTGPESYGVATGPLTAPPTAATPLPPGKAHAVSRGLGLRRRAAAPEVAAAAYTALPADTTIPPAELHVPPEQRLPEPEPERRLRPRRSRYPAGVPLAEAIVFPVRRHSLFAWLFLTFDLVVVAEVVTLVLLFPVMGPALGAFAGILALPTMLYLSSCFFAVVEETAAGADDITWPEAGGLIDGWARAFHLFWLVACCALPVAVVWQAGRDAFWSGDIWWLVPLVALVVLFPIVTLSSLASNSRWLIIDRDMLSRFVRRPHLVGAVWLVSVLLLVPCVWLVSQAALRPGFAAGAAAAVACATAVLIYARILGWAGLRLTREISRPKGRSRPAGPRAVEVDGWGPDEPDDTVEVETEPPPMP